MTEEKRIYLTHKKYLESALALLDMASKSKDPIVCKAYLDHLYGFLEGGISAMESLSGDELEPSKKGEGNE